MEKQLHTDTAYTTFDIFQLVFQKRKDFVLGGTPLVYFSGTDFDTFPRNDTLHPVIPAEIHIHRIFLIYVLVNVFHEEQLRIFQYFFGQFFLTLDIVQVRT